MARRKKNRSKPQEPHWAPLPRRQLGALETASIVARHLVPLASMWFFGGSALQFLLLSVFNLAFTVACIGTVGVAVSLRPIGWMDAVAGVVTLVLIGCVLTLLLTALFGWVIVVVASDKPQRFFDAMLAWSALAIVVCAAPELYRQYQSDRSTNLSETQRKQRDQPIVFAHVLSAGLIFLMSGHLLAMGRFGLIAMTLLTTALFLFRDLRPDLVRELARPNHRPP